MRELMFGYLLEILSDLVETWYLLPVRPF